MNDQRRQYSYDDLFPERWLHAPDLDGRAVTLTITAAYAEFIENPKKHKKDDPGELCGVLSFKGTKREYVLSKQNAWILKALWGKDAEAYVGKRITLSPVADSSGFTEHGTRILFTGSPDVDNDLSFNLPGGKHLTFKQTAAGKEKVEEASVDPVTGEVGEDEDDDSTPFDDLDDEQAAGDTESGQTSDPGADAAADAFSGPDDADGASEDDDDVPGRGALFDASDPERPATSADKKRLSEAIAHVKPAEVKAYRQRFDGRGNQDLTHGECEAFAAWAVKAALS
jgi:hypothetical protein